MTEGRRDRRKRLTRTRIGECGWELFATRGFDEVTVAEIADLADVAVGTVFNYFPTKEAILFDRADELRADLVASVTRRAQGQGAVAAFLAWHERTIGFLTAGDRTRRLLELVAGSATLRAHERDLDDRYRTALTAALGGSGPTPALLAAQLVALHRTVADLARDLILAGRSTRTVRARAAAATTAGSALLSEDAHAYGRGHP